jgi:ubiquitin-protein ligase
MEPRIWFVRLTADKDYPTKPPLIQFSSKINMDCVDPATGRVRPERVPYLASWNANKSMHGALSEIKALIARAPRAQPAEDATY